MGDRQSLLILTWPSPLSLNSGERVRVHAIAEELSATFDVTVLTYDNARHNRDVMYNVRVSKFPVPYRSSRVKLVLSTVFCISYHSTVLAMRRSRRAELSRVIEELGPASIIVSQLPPWGLLPKDCKCRIVWDSHNAEFLRLDRRADGSSGRIGWFRSKIFSRQAQASRRLERRIAQACDQIWAVSESDAEYFHSLCKCDVRVVPNGYYAHALGVSRLRPDVTHLNLLFVGSLSYSANLEGLIELVDKWMTPGIPAMLTVVGSGNAERAAEVCAGNPAVVFKGQVESVSPHYVECDALVVPLRSGGGTRLKAMEAVGHGLPIISTGLGVEGTGLIEGEGFLRAENPREFAAAVERFMVGANRERVAGIALRTCRSMTWRTIGREAATHLRSRP